MIKTGKRGFECGIQATDIQALWKPAQPEGWLSHGGHAMGMVTWFVLTVGLSLPANSQVEIMEKQANRWRSSRSVRGAFSALKPYLNNWTVFIPLYLVTWVGTSKILATGRSAPGEPAMPKWYKSLTMPHG